METSQTTTTKYTSQYQLRPRPRERQQQWQQQQQQQQKKSRPLRRNPQQNRRQKERRTKRRGQKSTSQTGPCTSSSSSKLHLAYTTPNLPGSFSGVQNLKRYTKSETFNTVKRYLATQDAYTLHKQRRLRFPRRKTFSKRISDLYQADLADVSALSRYNDGHKYLLVAIDVFTKVSWEIPLKSKNANFVTSAFEKVLTPGPTAAMLQTDSGTEFTKS